MDKIMPVDILSSIKGSKPSKTVNKLFEEIKKAHTIGKNLSKRHLEGLNALDISKKSVYTDNLREDVVIESSLIERQIITENFPQKKDGYLVVSKVIEG